MLAVPLDAVHLPTGTLLHEGLYRLEDEIGRGGYGVTYRATKMDDEVLVAIKECFFPGCRREGEAISPCDDGTQKALDAWGERVLAQAERLRPLQHPHLAHTLEAWRENNTVYLAMELLEGPTLAQVIEARERLPFEEALQHASELAGALDALHERGLVHLDVKPENAILTERGAVLLDFDLVQPSGEADFSTRPLSLAGRIGTPGYAPPEAYGEHAPQGTPSDVYALGATLYFLLGGQTPPSAVDRAAGLEVLPLDIAPHLQEALEAALQLPINARPATIGEFQAMWVPPPAPLPPPDDFAFSQHHASMMQSQLASGVYRVVLTQSDPEFPARCACCFEKADVDTHITINSPSGKRYIPGCQVCLRHQHVARASSNGTGWGAGLSVPIVALGAILCVTSDSSPFQFVLGFLLCICALFVYFASISYGAHKSSRAEEMLKSSCCHSLEPVTYSFNGRVYIWRFKNVLYAEEFKKKNADFVV